MTNNILNQNIENHDEDKFRDECGVFGVFSKEEKNIASIACYALYNLQHRGQESAGISVMSKNTIETYKGMGLIPEALENEHIENLIGNAAIAHVRYSTQGSKRIENAQPLENRYKLGKIAVAHNGNLVNAKVIRELMEESGSTFSTDSDSEIIIKMIAKKASEGIIEAIKSAVSVVKGSYALVILVDGKLIGVRDGLGIRPLIIGQSETGDYCLASESCALDAIEAKIVRDVSPGEIVVIDESGIKSIIFEENNKRLSCSFEYIYFARPDSVIDGISVYESRIEAGKLLARQKPVDADIVVGVPDSGLQAAIGYCEETGIKFVQGLVKNKYIGRTFIKPSQELREKAVRVKLNALRTALDGKRVVLVDDSLVRGTTCKNIIRMIRRCGAKEVHFRLASPIVKYPCHYGIDTSNKGELIGSVKMIDEICQEIGADSLDYLSYENLIKSLGGKHEYCAACFNGEYPIAPLS